MPDLQSAANSAGQAGQPAQTSGQQPVIPAVTPENPGGNNAPQYVTKAEAQGMVQEALRQAQSMTDKSKAQVMNEVERLTKAGITATPEQVQKMISAEEANQSQQVNSQQQQAAQPAAQENQPLDPVVRKALKIQDELGVKLDPDDPEMQLVVQTDDPEEFLNSVRAAVNKKSERVKASGNPGRIPALLGGSTSHTVEHAGMSATQTLNAGFEKFRNEHSK